MKNWLILYIGRVVRNEYIYRYGYFYALLGEGDINHMDALAIMTHIFEGRFGKAVTTDYVVLETTLLLKARIGPEVVKSF